MRAYFKLLYAFFCIIFAITLRLIELSIVENFKIWATNWICHPFLSRFPYWLNRNVFFCSRSYAKIWGIISNRFSWSLSSCNFFAFEREPGARCLCICFWLGELLQDDALSRSDFCSFLSCVCLDFFLLIVLSYKKGCGSATQSGQLFYAFSCVWAFSVT